MRVTAGAAKGIKLTSPKGLDTRPTADRIKQSLFNIIAGDLAGASFLDLFSGSGQIGIEALSRGAAECGFVENNKRAMSCILKNIELTHFNDKAETYLKDSQGALRAVAGLGKSYDIIFMDPPYTIWEQIVSLSALVKDLRLLKPKGYIIAEHGADVDIAVHDSICVFKEKSFGKTTAISFFTLV